MWGVQTVSSSVYIVHTLDMIDLGFFSLKKSLLQVFGRIKLHKKRSRNTFFSYLRNVLRF